MIPRTWTLGDGAWRRSIGITIRANRMQPTAADLPGGWRRSHHLSRRANRRLRASRVADRPMGTGLPGIVGVTREAGLSVTSFARIPIIHVPVVSAVDRPGAQKRRHIPQHGV